MSLVQIIKANLVRGLMRRPDPQIVRLAGKTVVAGGQSLDPRVQLLIRMSKRKPAAGDDAASIAVARAACEAECDLLPPKTARPVAAQDMVLPGGDGPRQVRLYRPEGLAPQNAPALIYYHGGGHVIGSLTSHDPICRALADAAGVAVLAVDYRMAPEAPFPAGIEDCVAIYRALVAQAGDLGLDPARIAVGGDSAGGNCAAVVAQQCRDDAHPPACQLLYVPWVDMAEKRGSYRDFAEGFLLDEARMDWFTRLYLNGADPTDPRASPMRGDLSGLCPAIILTAACDVLRDEGEAYADALSAAGVPVSFERVPGMPHVFMNISGGVQGARAALDRSAALLAAALHPKEAE